MSRRSFATFLSSVAALSLVSIASAEDPNRASKVLTADVAQKCLGGAIDPKKTNCPADIENGKTWMSRAFYTKQAESKAPQVGLLLRHADSKDQAKSIFESSKSTFHGVAVAGLGDAAYRTTQPAQLNVLKGPHWLIITAGTFSAPDTAMQETVAKEILPKVAAE